MPKLAKIEKLENFKINSRNVFLEFIRSTSKKNGPKWISDTPNMYHTFQNEYILPYSLECKTHFFFIFQCQKLGVHLAFEYILHSNKTAKIEFFKENSKAPNQLATTSKLDKRKTRAGFDFIFR